MDISHLPVRLAESPQIAFDARWMFLPVESEIRYFWKNPRDVGLTGLEPVTLRLSSACSNQLSYRPWVTEVGHGTFI